MTELKFKSGEIVLNASAIAKAYHPLVAAELANQDAQDTRVMTLEIPLPEQGPAWILETKPEDDVFYAAVQGTRNQLSRFAFGREPETGPLELIVVMKWRRKMNGFLIKSVIKGSRAMPEPWDQENSTEESRRWWLTHAFIYDQKNPLLQGSHPWRHQTIHCFRCNTRQSRKTAIQCGDLMYCKGCATAPNQRFIKADIGGWRGLTVLA